MKSNKSIYRYFILFGLIISFSCREEIALETNVFESTIVVEATITNELKIQEINISKTYFLESAEQVLENNATVYIEDNLQNVFTFTQNTEGVYISNTEFKAEPDRDYILHITTANGKNYQSITTTLTPEAQITNMYPEVVDNETVTVFIDVDGTENNTKYYRYHWEETYKIIAPNHSEFDATIEGLTIDTSNNNNGEVIASSISYGIAITPREQEERKCYSSNKSTGITQASSSELDSNLISRLPIRVIPVNSAELINRYSIIVTQVTQNLESYSYYKTIKELGDTSSILSSSQPGYIQGNINSTTDSSEKVLGFFNVASIAKKRIYFNYFDLGLEYPDYFYDCEEITYNYLDDSVNPAIPGDVNERYELYQLLEFGNYKFVAKNGTFYTITKPECGDCTSFSSNVQPDFWID
ncbi:DUF4249 domain-containing protein [Lacinutrix algicola]|uniref:DUF4249 domain-containing protein n=1 Tax=Lacinutrix algicola TaxID=342954 RepID=UPI0006E300BD|nr:DUF4249 domain-containing protein [Lacinutrix algicola]